MKNKILKTFSFLDFLESRLKIFSIIFGTILFCFLGLLISQLILSYKKDIQHSKRNISNLSLVLEQHVSHSFNSADYGLIKIKDYIEDKVASGLKLEKLNMDSYLSEEAKLIPNVVGFRVSNKDGYVVYPSTIPADSKKVVDREYFQIHKADPNLGRYISNPILGRITKKMGLVISRRINDKNGSFLGTVHTVFNVEDFAMFFRSLLLDENSVVALWSSENILLARFPYIEESIGKHKPPRKILSEILASHSPSAEFEDRARLDSVERLFSYRKIQDYPVYMVIGLSKDAILSDWKKRLYVSILGIVFVLAVSLLSLYNYLKYLKFLETQREVSFQASKMSALGEMAAGIAHEINNPLTIIINQAKQLQRTIDPSNQDADKTMSGLKKIEQISFRIAKIISGLKNLSRNDDEDPKIDLEMNLIIQDTLMFSKARSEETGISISVECPVEIRVNCRPSQISQVILNLLNNAFDAIHSLEEKWIQIIVTSENGKAIVAITDSGKGIAPEVVQKLMQPFFTTKATGKGTGLGLSISKRIIEENDGIFYYDSKARNTCFKFELPLI